ncbi:MAG TPA: hypothetical protein PKW90_22820, partial [Myxococcota bacterium]|nr:hypothetical protein [Myxococcota bacterium]
MSQSAATFFGFWEGVRGSQYQNQLPNGAVVELRQAGAKHKGGAGGGGLFGPQGPGNPTAPSPSDPCIEDTVPMPYVASKTPEDCYDYCRSHADNLSGYAACLFNCYGGAIGEGGCACPSGDSAGGIHSRRDP